MKTFLVAAAVATCCFAGAASADSFEQIKIDAGRQFFDGQCHRCHAPNSKDPSYGPSLKNVIGRKAGSVPGFAYSEALKKSGIVWTPAALRAWMEDNTGFMPGTRMRHVGIEDRTVQDFILAYLESISNGKN